MESYRYPPTNTLPGIDYLEILVIENKLGTRTNVGNVTFDEVNTVYLNRGNKRYPAQRTTRVTRPLESFIREEGTAKNQRKNALASIILPMPSNITDSNQVTYSDDSLDAVTAEVAGRAKSLMKSSSSEDFASQFTSFAKSIGTNSPMLKEIFLGKLAAEAAGIPGVGNITLNQILARGENQILNPNMELLFSSPTIRNFKFSFKMTPRDNDESEQVKNIIRTFKKNMAPKTENKYFLGTPNIFELRYRTTNNKNGEVTDHKFLHTFKQCALTDMSVKYTGENIYATYSDGTPVSMIMDLTFKELEPIYSSDYTDDIGGVGY